MSYDMSIADVALNYTYNGSQVWYDAVPDEGIRVIYGKTGAEALPILRGIRTHLEDNFARLRQYDSPNGWGSLPAALAFLNEIIAASIQHPGDVWNGD